VLKILSEAKQDNAVFDIANKDLTLQGVSNVRLSKAKDVVILPRNNTISIGKNRNLNFNGTVLGGRVDFVGNNFKMDYENFSITMPEMRTPVNQNRRCKWYVLCRYARKQIGLNG